MQLASWCVTSSHASSTCASSMSLLFIWHKAMELDVHAHQHCYKCQYQKFTGQVVTGQKRKKRWAWFKTHTHTHQGELEERVSVPGENRQRGQAQGTRDSCASAIQKKKSWITEIKERGGVSLVNGSQEFTFLVPLPHRTTVYSSRLFPYAFATK